MRKSKFMLRMSPWKHYKHVPDNTLIVKAPLKTNRLDEIPNKKNRQKGLPWDLRGFY